MGYPPHAHRASGINGDRRHGQGTDNPANGAATIQQERQFSCRRRFFGAVTRRTLPFQQRRLSQQVTAGHLNISSSRQP